MCKLSKEDFKKVEKFVVSKGDNLNEDRCIILLFKNRDITCCMDEIKSEIRICQIDRQDSECLMSMMWEDEIIELAKNAEYTEGEQEKYENYTEEIKMMTECCDMDCGWCSSIFNT